MNDNIFDEDENSGFFTDDGEKLNPDLIPKPDLCTTCRKDEDPKEEILCSLNRLDQADEEEFVCYAYKSKFEEENENDKEKDKENDRDNDVIKF